MRRRPLELWWIAAFFIARAAGVLDLGLTAQGYEEAALLLYGITLTSTAALLLWFAPPARWAAAILLGLEAALQTQVILQQPPSFWGYAAGGALLFACVWSFAFLAGKRTARQFQWPALFVTSARARLAVVTLDVMDVALAATAACVTLELGGHLFLATAAGLASFLGVGRILDRWVRPSWLAWVSPVPEGVTADDARNWRRARLAFERGDFSGARRQLNAMQAASRCVKELALLEALLNWNALMRTPPLDGRGCLYRSILDFHYRPLESEQGRMATAAAELRDNELRDLLEGRAQLIESVVEAACQPDSPFYHASGAVLYRLTGLQFSYNPAPAWRGWWAQVRQQFRGDAASVALVARLIRVAPPAADVIAQRAAQRAEEPLLKQLSAQVLFLTSMQRALQERRPVDEYLRQAPRMLLIPELADAIGMQHTDAPTMDLDARQFRAFLRQLQARAKLIEYAANLWTRYPQELDEDMPWLLKTLTAQSLTARRSARSFHEWWEQHGTAIREHDKAVADGLLAHKDHRADDEVPAWRKAIELQPRSLSARYNLALCLEKKKDPVEASKLLQELTELEPREPYWWIVLGRLQRSISNSADAHAAFRKALQLGAAAPRVALQIGLTFAHDHRDDEAKVHLDRWLGRNPPVSKIEALVAALEEEGLWTLARHFREQVFRRELDAPNSPNEEGPTEGGEESTA